MKEKFETDPIVKGEVAMMPRLALTLVVAVMLMLLQLTLDPQEALRVTTTWERIKLVKWQFVATIFALIIMLIVWVPVFIAHFRAMSRTDGSGYF